MSELNAVEIADRLARIETKIDTVLVPLEERMSKVEKKVWIASGSISLAAAFALPKLRAMLGM